MSVPSEITGIHQGDIIVRTGLLAAIEDLRANDWLLDYAFASLPNDLLTKAEYGEQEIDRAKNWFRNNRFPVLMSYEITDPKLPCISISIGEGGEAETTLGDTHYVEQQEDDRIWPALTPVFQASYGPITGQLIVPAEISSTLVLAPGQQVIDRAGTAHEILEVVDDQTVMIKPATADFSKAVIKGKRPSGITKIGSVKHREVYVLGCHVQGEPTHLIYLFSILTFCLYHYKATLFEARGFERHTVQNTEFRRNEAFENENTWSRHLTLTGYVAHVWPEATNQKITGVGSTAIVSGAGQQPDPEDQLWMGEEDALLVGLGIKKPGVSYPNRVAENAPAPPTNGLVAWFSSQQLAYNEGDFVAVWPNLALGGISATALEYYQPQFKRPAGEPPQVQFNGVQSRMELLGSQSPFAFLHTTGVFDIIAVLRRRNSGTFVTPFGSTGTTAEKGLYFSLEPNGSINAILVKGTAGTPIVNHVCPTTVDIGVPTTLLYRGTGTASQISKNFGAFHTAPFTSGLGAGNASQTFKIGDISNSTGTEGGQSFFDGDLFEFFVYNRNLTDAELQKLQSFLALKGL